MFREAREAQHLSQEQLADLTDGQLGGSVSRAMISAIERGQALPGIKVLLSLTGVLHVEPAEVVERIRLARTVPVDLTGLSFDLLGRKAEEFFWAGDYRSALAVYDATFERLVLDPPQDSAERTRLQVRTEINRAVALRRCSALKAARASAERAIQLADGRPEPQAEAYIVLASLLSHEELLVLARDAGTRAVELSKTGDLRLRSQALTQQGNVLSRSGKFKEARAAFLEAYGLARKARDHHNLIKLEGNIGACLMALGSTTQAGTRFAKAIDLARRYGDPAPEAFWLIELGRLALADDKLDEADRHASAALRIAKPREHHLTVFRAEWLRHQVCRRRDPEDADRHRLSYLRKLFPRVKEHKSFDPIREFKQQVLEAPAGSERRWDASGSTGSTDQGSSGAASTGP